MKCEQCGADADVHVTSIHDGVKVEQHFCSQCAAKTLGLPGRTGLEQRLERFSSRIHAAAADGELEELTALVKENPDLVFSKDDAGWTPLHVAAFHGQTEAAELLLTHDADVNAADNAGCTPCFHAVAHGHKDVADLLRRHGGHE